VDVFAPRQLARAVLPWLALLLAVTGVGALAFGIFVDHPEVIRFSTMGHSAIGRVQTSPAWQSKDGRRGFRNRSLITVDDSELGLQTVSVYGELAVGATVPLLCLTSARRCVSADEVRQHLDMWPLTPVMLAGAVLIALAATLTYAARRRR